MGNEDVYEETTSQYRPPLQLTTHFTRELLP